MISPPFRMEYPPVCMLSVFVPAHFWPSLKHLFSRCCSWQALHDIQSEILMGNQTASRPLAATIHRRFFAVQISVFSSYLPFFLFFFFKFIFNSQWQGTDTLSWSTFWFIHFISVLSLTLSSWQLHQSQISTQVFPSLSLQYVPQARHQLFVHL